MTIINELKELSNYLTNLESDLSAFFNLSLDLLLIADSDGKFIKTNPSWTSLLGYQIEELKGQTFTTIIHQDDRELWRNTLQSLLYVSAPKVILRMRNKYNEYRTVSWSFSKVVDGKFYCIGRDVTEVYDKINTLETKVVTLEDKVKDVEKSAE